MKRQFVLINICLLISFIISLNIFIITKNNIVEIIIISIGVTLYHFVMRLIVGTIVNCIMKNKADYQKNWFSEKKLENKLYKILRVKKWKKYLPTYNPDSFDINSKSINEIIGATCQAEIVHEVIMVLSLLPLILIPFLGGAIAMIITSILAMMIDFIFVIIQRYNRPRLIRIIEQLKMKSYR
jgi:hypothetical protein